ncbi:MAG: sulfatase [Actinobacteria bacterium]|nr:sulfatase [Actinomycetota bacterium]
MTTGFRRSLLLGVTASWLVLAWTAQPASARGPRPAQATTSRPNVVVIQLDDMIVSDLYARYLASAGVERPRWWGRLRWNWWDPSSYRRHWEPVLPNIRRLLIDKGSTFARYYASEPLCCPSRAALLTGRYAHDNSVQNNGGERRGFEAFERHDYHNNLAVWLERAGYYTIHVGKFLNGYESNPPTPPPGWRDWLTLASNHSDGDYYGYTLNENGTVSAPYGSPTYLPKDPRSCHGQRSARCKYVTDVLTRKALRAMETAPRSRPFYLQIDYTAPHVDGRGEFGPEPPTRYTGMLPGISVPRVPGFNEASMADKPAFLRGLPLLTAPQIAGIRRTRELRLESERGVDDGVKRLFAMLARLGRLRNTYVFLTSDNGWFQGEHRLAQGKFLPFEPSTHMPLLVRGPGIPAGSTSQQLAANVDLAPTILQIAHARPNRTLDGISLLPYAKDPHHTVRRAVLLEGFTRGKGLQTPRGPGGAPPVAYEGIRVGPYKYIKYSFGPVELYDITRDPYEVHSLAHDPRYHTVESWLGAHLRRLEECEGASCHMTVGAIPRPGTSPRAHRERSRVG